MSVLSLFSFRRARHLNRSQVAYREMNSGKRPMALMKLWKWRLTTVIFTSRTSTSSATVDKYTHTHTIVSKDEREDHQKDFYTPTFLLKIQVMLF